MRIVICEDNRNDAELLIKIIYELTGYSPTDWFVSSEQLLNEYANGQRYDLLFMDIQLPGMNGFEAAKIIHHEYHDERPLIVFLTITDKYVFDAYNIGWDYVCKPIQKECIGVMIDSAQTELSYRTIPMQTTDGLVYFKSRDIIYLESFYGEVKIITKNHMYRSRMSLKRIQDLLGKRPFYLTHRSYVVNLAHVTRYTQTGVFMSDGKMIPQSRNRRKEFVACMENFHRGFYYGQWDFTNF